MLVLTKALIISAVVVVLLLFLWSTGVLTTNPPKNPISEKPHGAELTDKKLTIARDGRGNGKSQTIATMLTDGSLMIKSIHIQSNGEIKVQTFYAPGKEQTITHRQFNGGKLIISTREVCKHMDPNFTSTDINGNVKTKDQYCAEYAKIDVNIVYEPIIPLLGSVMPCINLYGSCRRPPQQTQLIRYGFDLNKFE
jgi:hypothetical protein